MINLTRLIGLGRALHQQQTIPSRGKFHKLDAVKKISHQTGHTPLGGFKFVYENASLVMRKQLGILNGPSNTLTN